MTSLRERRKTETRQTVQRHALRLFEDRGYDETTVNDVAQAAGVSAMTVYRHFPTKEDLVLWDEYSSLTATVLAELPPEEHLARRIGHALIQTATTAIGASPSRRQLLLTQLRLMISVPALRARHLDNQYAAQDAIVRAVCGEEPDPDQEFHTRAISGACLGVTHIALVRWAKEDGKPDLAALLREALAATFPAEFS
ncbi:TetR/AcrR family transcriptional regulator [Kribbella amoyensis]|nr:TetR/AcrR family transcriptional regulator [Kribbella amoyensis]